MPTYSESERRDAIQRLKLDPRWRERGNDDITVDAICALTRTELRLREAEELLAQALKHMEYKRDHTQTRPARVAVASDMGKIAAFLAAQKE